MSKKNLDLAAGEVDPTAKLDDPTLTPEGFDLAAWIAGVNPVRRRVTIYGRGDLQARIDELSQAEALARGAERELLEAELVELTEQLKASAMVFEIEGRTSTAVMNIAKALREEGVPDEDIDLGLIAAQCVNPPITLDQVRALRSKREADVLRLANVVADANNRPVTLDPRFLRAASD